MPMKMKCALITYTYLLAFATNKVQYWCVDSI